jgi:hypothetical protein
MEPMEDPTNSHLNNIGSILSPPEHLPEIFLVHYVYFLSGVGCFTCFKA